jgi:stress-induced morphogen
LDAVRLKQILESGIPDAEVDATDLKGTGDHFEVTVVAASFEGKSLVQRHRLVYDALGDAMQSEIHALMINALSPDQHRSGLIQKIDRS